MQQLIVDDWQTNIISSERGVKLIELEENCYVVEYLERVGSGCYRRRAVYGDYAIAENNYVRRVEEADRG